jgi:hypothetical protein
VENVGDARGRAAVLFVTQFSCFTAVLSLLSFLALRGDAGGRAAVLQFLLSFLALLQCSLITQLTCLTAVLSLLGLLSVLALLRYSVYSVCLLSQMLAPGVENMGDTGGRAEELSYLALLALLVQKYKY